MPYKTRSNTQKEEENDRKLTLFHETLALCLPQAKNNTESSSLQHVQGCKGELHAQHLTAEAKGSHDAAGGATGGE